MMQAIVVIIREKKKISSPVMTAPTMLVAGNVTARRITDVSIVPSIPVRRNPLFSQIHLLAVSQAARTVAKNVIARYTMAMPNTVQRNAGVTVIMPVMRSRAATMPRMMLAPRLRAVQEILQQQFIDRSPFKIWELSP